MRKRDESGVMTSPRPAPISSRSDLLMPAFAVFGACVLSISWARTVGAKNSSATARLLIVK